MPITPLHLGVLAPLNHWFPNKVSNLSFLLVTLWLDANAIMYFGFGMNMGELHGPGTHSFFGALALATIIAVCNTSSLKWILGAYLGATSHVLLDMLVHSEMLPLYPIEGNPFYFAEGMPWVSAALVLPTCWLIAQYVSYSLGYFSKTKGAPPL